MKYVKAVVTLIVKEIMCMQISPILHQTRESFLRKYDCML